MTTEATLIENVSLTLSPWPQYEAGDVICREVVDTIESVASPIIIGLGLTGNAVGSASLLRVAGLRSRGIGHLLVAICVSDAIFLASLLPTWLGHRYGRGYDLYNSDGWCELLSLTTMSSNFLSTWFTVALGVERYVAVRHSRRHGRENRKPQTSKRSCGPTRTRVAIIALTVLATVVFVNMVVNIGVVKRDDGAPVCVPLPPAVDVMHVLNNVDLVVNVIAPGLIIAGLYSVIGVRLAVSRCRRGRAISRLAPPSTPRSADGDDDGTTACPTEIRLTRSAVLLSAVVVLLSAPSHALRTAHIVAQLFRLPVSVQTVGGSSVVQLVVREFFYASFAVPFFVVVASHSRIRRSIVLSVRLALESAWKRLRVACSWR